MGRERLVLTSINGSLLNYRLFMNKKKKKRITMAVPFIHA
jgi:hypothetical protein